MWKKHIAKLLVFAMVLSMLPFAAAAVDANVGSYITLGDSPTATVSNTAHTLTHVGSGNGTSIESAYQLTLPEGTKVKANDAVTISFKVTAANGQTLCGVYKVDGDTTTLTTTNKVDNAGTVNNSYTIPADTETASVLYCAATESASGGGQQKAEPTKTYIRVDMPVGTDEAETAAIEFTVTDNDGAVAGATVSVGDVTGTTDAEGKATLELPEGEASYTVSKSGYEDATGTVTVTAENISGTTHEGVSVTMTKTVVPADKAAVEFTVTDSEGAIAGATITIGDESKTTDAEGKATFNLSEGETSYTVSMDGYEDATGTPPTTTTAAVEAAAEAASLLLSRALTPTDPPPRLPLPAAAWPVSTTLRPARGMLTP